MKRKRSDNPLYRALQLWNRLPQNSGNYFGLSLALDSNLRIFQYHPGRIKLAPGHILTVSREGSAEEPEVAGLSIYRSIHARSRASIVLFLKSVSTLLGAHYWCEPGMVHLPANLRIPTSPQSGPLSVSSEEGALLVDGQGLFVWGHELESVRDRLTEIDFQLSYQIQLLCLPDQSARRGSILDGGWRLPALHQSRGGIFSL